jgi:hypothetical protein
MSAALAKPFPIPVGLIKSIGPTGPIYEVLGSALPGKKGEMVSIRIIHGGETLDYPLADMLADPQVP